MFDVGVAELLFVFVGTMLVLTVGCRITAVGRTPEATAQAMDVWLSRTAQREQV